MKINRGVGSLLVTAVVLVVASSAVTWIASTNTGETVQVEAANSPGAVPAFIPRAGTAATPRRPLHTAGHVVSGDAPGLYGGVEANSCDVAAMQAFLRTHPDHAAAWAAALMIEPSQIDEHFASLTPVSLQTDTAVTNHGFDSGAATPIQSVLQAGTAVLVDAVGLPRVRCYCGNPLQTPASRRNPRYVGVRWDGFDAQSVTQIATASTVIQQFVIVEREPDGAISKVVNRPRATTGDRDSAVDPILALTLRSSLQGGGIGSGQLPPNPGSSSAPSSPDPVGPTSSAIPGPPESSTAAPVESSSAPTPTPTPGTTSAAPASSEIPDPQTSVIPEPESPATTEPDEPATTEPDEPVTPEPDEPARPEPDEPVTPEPDDQTDVDSPEPEVDERETEEGDSGREEGDDEGDGGPDEGDTGGDG
ncbi:hypothetical protein FHX44_115727 [Pseudonocardia hierapolitana]|uniref:DUF6777 domain-containing protein n=1 Tax=Pseudonocardia hierapolitana TaxID=1128676 RepID=A0A561SY83_9PSEU|nr:DUF6777 domain-containing protein [Pseudonocardia hierapolitana]TWF79792.1 hypothetical protein FHX44_115727 [Pseudonocardia hierapolitana]